MRLKTKKGVFRKYGKNLRVKSKKGFVIYPTPSYRRPSQFSTIMHFSDNLIEKYM